MAVSPIPADMNGALAYLFVENAADAIDWYVVNFGAVETMRMPGPQGQGIMHGEISLGGRTLMLSDANPQWGTRAPRQDEASTAKLMLYVERVDDVLTACEANGAMVTKPAEDMFWGDRMGEICDPFGHRWMLATRVEDVSEAEIAKRARQAFGPGS